MRATALLFLALPLLCACARLSLVDVPAATVRDVILAYAPSRSTARTAAPLEAMNASPLLLTFGAHNETTAPCGHAAVLYDLHDRMGRDVAEYVRRRQERGEKDAVAENVTAASAEQLLFPPLHAHTKRIDRSGYQPLRVGWDLSRLNVAYAMARVCSFFGVVPSCCLALFCACVDMNSAFSRHSAQSDLGRACYTTANTWQNYHQATPCTTGDLQTSAFINMLTNNMIPAVRARARSV